MALPVLISTESVGQVSVSKSGEGFPVLGKLQVNFVPRVLPFCLYSAIFCGEA